MVKKFLIFFACTVFFCNFGMLRYRKTAAKNALSKVPFIESARHFSYLNYNQLAISLSSPNNPIVENTANTWDQLSMGEKKAFAQLVKSSYYCACGINIIFATRNDISKNTSNYEKKINELIYALSAIEILNGFDDEHELKGIYESEEMWEFIAPEHIDVTEHISALEKYTFKKFAYMRQAAHKLIIEKSLDFFDEPKEELPFGFDYCISGKWIDDLLNVQPNNQQ